jgi:hypothetical protein
LTFMATVLIPHLTRVELSALTPISMAVFRSPPWKTLGVISKGLTYGKTRRTGRLLLSRHDEIGLGRFGLRRLNMM